MLSVQQNVPGVDIKLRRATIPDTQYFLSDHLGSTNGLTNSSGIFTASNSYDSFGNATNSGFPTRYQYTGRELDSFTGLQYNRARFYDPDLGRFISEDPIGFGGGDINLYGYVKNRPLMHRDPSGLDDGDMNPNPFSNNDPPYDWDAYYDRLKEQSGHLIQYQGLSKCSKSWLGKYFPDIDLDGIRIHDGIPWYVPIDASGYTDGPDIYIKKGEYKPATIPGLGLVGHELTHTRQYQNDGVWPFRLQYAWDTIKNLGYGPDIPYENQANKNGLSIERDLRLRGSQGEIPCGCDEGLKP